MFRIRIMSKTSRNFNREKTHIVRAVEQVCMDVRCVFYKNQASHLAFEVCNTGRSLRVKRLHADGICLATIKVKKRSVLPISRKTHLWWYTIAQAVHCDNFWEINVTAYFILVHASWYLGPLSIRLFAYLYVIELTQQVCITGTSLYPTIA